MTDLERRIAVARGDEPADLVISGGRVLSVFTREWLECDVAVVDGWIAGLGSYDGRERIDATGRYVVPGFIDAHVHLESSKLLAGEFARLVLPFGTTTVVADPHEIANVLGTDGVHWLLDATEGMPLDVRFTASSCVPASKFESPRAGAERGRPGGAPAAPAGGRARRDDELPRRDRGRSRASSRSSRSRAPSGPTATRPGCAGRRFRPTPRPASAPTTSRRRSRRAASGCGPACGS